MTFPVMFAGQAAPMTNTTEAATADPRPFHHRALAETKAIVAAVRPGHLAQPTPCAEYDVRTLLSHIVGAQLAAWLGRQP